NSGLLATVGSDGRDQDFAWRLEQLACPERAKASRTGRQNGSSSNPIAPTILRVFQVSELNLDLDRRGMCSFRLQKRRFVVTSRSLQLAARSGAAGSRRLKR